MLQFGIRGGSVPAPIRDGDLWDTDFKKKFNVSGLGDGIIASRSLSMLVVLATSSCRTHNRDFGATVPSPPLDVGVVAAHRRDMPSLT
ncbi:hypothetical protein DY000_02007962 [Brassica cretica]|uniref:Uncharacterized protein n=1 Tax=Brassica cretica TaxID=69181 RepID=A0ABQ7BSA4_BRACR|nr:hypothetical protein DY000_02007962 [Brassica cretica]